MSTSLGTAADGGEGSPSDGNLLPLLAFLLNALPPQALSCAADASAAAGGEGSSSATAAGQASVQDLLKQLTAALNLQKGASSAGTDVSEGFAALSTNSDSAGSTPLPGELLRQLMQADSASSGLETNELPQALKDAIAKLLPAAPGADKNAATAANTVMPGAGAELRPAGAAVDPASATAAAELPRIDAATAAALRQWLASKGMPVSADASGQAPTSSPRDAQAVAGATVSAMPGAEVDNPLSIEHLAARLEAVRAGLNSAPAMGNETRHWLHAAGLERAAVLDMMQPSSMVASHGLLARPAGGDAAPATPLPMLQLNAPMNSPQWAENLGDHIVWVADQNLSSAQIKLNPAHLGPIEVSVSMGEDQTSVSFVAHHSATREALEAAAPRLREVLNAHGLGNVNVNIDQQASGRSSAQPQGYDAWQAFDRPAAEASAFGTTATPTAARPSVRSLIDTYA